MKFELSFSVDNAAFDDANFYPEIARCLNDTATRIMNGDLLAVDDEGESRPIRDINGNTIGSFQFTGV